MGVIGHRRWTPLAAVAAVQVASAGLSMLHRAAVPKRSFDADSAHRGRHFGVLGIDGSALSADQLLEVHADSDAFTRIVANYADLVVMPPLVVRSAQVADPVALLGGSVEELG
jgi:hypothetical protein